MTLYDWSDRMVKPPTATPDGTPDGLRVIDAETGEEIPAVLWCDDESGDLQRLLLDENGCAQLREPNHDAPLTKIERRSFCVVPHETC